VRRLLEAVSFAGLMLLVGVVSASAQPESASASATGHSSLYYLLQAGLSLAVVVGLIYAIYFGLRRLSQVAPTNKSGRLHVLESRHLGGGRWVYILKVADRILIVGGSSEGLRTLSELPVNEFDQGQLSPDEKDGRSDDGSS